MSRAHWLSFHLFLDDSCIDGLLIQFIMPYLETAKMDIKRFFFIRHSEGGMHLRLRVLPAPRTAPQKIASALDDLVHLYNQSQVEPACSGCRIEQAAYDRTRLYFGDNLASSYAELLNEQTSQLALRLMMEQDDGKLRRFLVTASAMVAIHTAVEARPAAIARAVNSSLELVRVTMSGHGMNIPESADMPAKVLNYLSQHVPAMTTHLSTDPTIQRIGRLLKRTQRRPWANEIYTHSVHLFCNKLGFSLPGEYQLMRAVLTLCQPGT